MRVSARKFIIYGHVLLENDRKITVKITGN